ncbi:MAG: dihydrodipicolinate synthase family protein [Deinococcales bacterium]
MTPPVYAAALTPFTEDGALSLTQLPPYLEYLLARGVRGLLVLGTNGEFASLTAGERRAVLEAYLEAVEGRVPVVVNVGATAVSEVLALVRHASHVGADAAALLPPYYYPLTDKGFTALAEAAAEAFGKPLYLYNIPRYTGYAIPATVVAECVERGLARGLKDSSQDLAYFTEVRARAPRAELFVGSDTTLVEGLEAGADGVVSGLANTYPDLIVAVVRAFADGSSELSTWRERLLGVRTLFGRYPYLAATRYALQLRGLHLGPPRRPLIDLDAAGREELARTLDPLHHTLEEVPR